MTDHDSGLQAETSDAVDGSGEKTRAYVVHPVLPLDKRGGFGRRPDSRLAEAVGLTEALGVALIGSETAPTPSVRASTLFGSGKTIELGERFGALDIELVVVDAQLSPLQQRNLERAWKVKVLDRTGLILEIFGDRAQTREGVLQVELAHLGYQKSRLVRSWTHLERQRGGAGFMGGPGETQIESDRRQIGEKIIRLQRKLEKVAQTRRLHREGRSKRTAPVVALVGYTNAGKSTLFNRLTQAGVLAKDMLFATLDPTMRAAPLPGGGQAIFSDTVGFISDLPTELVAAFRATLEEVLSADLILHVRDIADPETEAQRSDVLSVLSDLGLSDDAQENVLEAWNKVDLLPEDAATAVEHAAERAGALCLSAVSGYGVDALLEEVERRLAQGARDVALELAPAEAAALAWLHQNARVLEAQTDPETGAARLLVRIGESERGRFEKRFGDLAQYLAATEDAAASQAAE